MDHEQAFTKAFITSEKRARFLQFLAGPKRRKEMAEHLNRPLPLLPGSAAEVPGAQDYPEPLERLLRAKGAGPTCHVISCDLKADGKDLPLREALDKVCLQADGAILSCLPGRLAYVKPASPGAGLILEKV